MGIEAVGYGMRCDACGAAAPMQFARPAEAHGFAVMNGWETVFGFALCPRCSEQGRLPEGLEDVRVTAAGGGPELPPGVRVVTEDDGEPDWPMTVRAADAT